MFLVFSRDLFLTIGKNLTTSTYTPYVPQVDNGTSSGIPDAAAMSSLVRFDVYAQPNFTPRADVVDGTAPPSGWHTSANKLGAPGEPYFVANGWGPKYINKDTGYQIVAPLVTPTQSQDTNFTLSTISMSATPSNVTVPRWTFPGAAAFQVLEGKLVIQIGEHHPYELITGDVAFVPGGVPLRYWSESYFTKVYFISSGHEGLDQKLIESGEAYEFVTFPTSW